MRKLNWGLFVVLMLISFGLTFNWLTTPAHADYTINNLTVNAKLDSQGGAWVTETVKYRFDSLYHGVYLVQDTNQLGHMRDLTVKINGQTIPDYTHDIHGWDNSFVIKHNVDGSGHHKAGYERVKVYHIVNDSTDTITYHFYLTAAGKRYLDTGEVNWKMIGNNWDRVLKHATVELTLPAQASPVSVWAHSTATYQLHHAGNTTTVTASNVSNFVELHSLFNKGALSKAPVINQHRRSQALKVEQRLETLARLKHGLIHNWLVTPLWLFLPLIVFMVPFLRTKAKLQTRNHSAEKLHRFDVPDVAPTIASAQYSYAKYGSSLDANVFTTQLVEAQSAGLISLDTAKANYAIKQLSPTLDEFPDIKRLLSLAGKNQSVTLKQVRKLSNSPTKSKRLAKWWENFTKKMVTKVTSRGKESQEYQKLISVLDIIGILLLVPESLLISTTFGDRLFTGGSWLFNWLATVIMMASMTFVGFLVWLFVYRWFARLFSQMANQIHNLVKRLTAFQTLLLMLVVFVAPLIYWVAPNDEIVSPLILGTVGGLFIFAGAQAWVAYRYSPYSAKAYADYLQVVQFKQMLHDIASFNDKQLPDQILWGEYLTYAVTVGEAARLTNQLKATFGVSAVDKVLIDQINASVEEAYLYGAFGGSFGASLGSGTGSFGGGASSGGAGGGSGGGAF